MSPIETVISKLVEAGCEPAQTSSGWQCRCPAHDDQMPSLSVSEGESDMALLKCHAGCDAKKIVASIGLTMKDLFPPRAPKAGETAKTKGKKKGHVFPTLDEAAESVSLSVSKALRKDHVAVARYIYHDAAGREELAVVRYEPDTRDGTKTCRPLHAAEGGWRIGDPEGPLPLYRLSAVRAGKGRVYVVEGEPCAEAGNGLGLTCTTSAHGSQSARKTDWSPLAGRDVIILPDHDEPGAMYACDAARILKGLNPPARVRIVELPDITESGDDIVDYIEFHKDKSSEDVRALIEALADNAQEWADNAPRAEILDESPDVIRRPLCIIGGRAYAASWVTVRLGEEDTTALAVLRADGKLFTDEPVPDAVPLRELGVKVDLPNIPDPGQIMSGAAVKRYAGGERPDPLEVFGRVSQVIDWSMDFGHSLGTQADLVDLAALYVLVTYALDAFNVVGFMWPNGDKGVGKTKFLLCITDLGYLGMLVLAGGTYASLRDLADYGGCIGFDDAEGIMDVRRSDPDKRALFLAGNRKGTYITLKELCGDNRWKTRRINAYCPRLFSAINLPDDVLASRTIVIPLVRSADGAKANNDPADHDSWPVDRRRLVDDLWAVGLSQLAELKKYDRLVPGRVRLVGRMLEPWRAVLAVALWLQERHGASGLFDRMQALAMHYQAERNDIELPSPVRVAIAALQSMMGASPSIEFTPTELAAAMNTIAQAEEIDHAGDNYTNARKVGALLRRLRLDRAQRTSGGKRWRATAGDLDALARAYGMPVPDTPPDPGTETQCRDAVGADDAVLRETPPAESGNGTPVNVAGDECRCAVGAVDAVLQVTPSLQPETAPDTVTAPVAVVAQAGNDLEWGGES